MNNRADEFGGAIYVVDSDMSWSGSMLLKHNSAQYGGALYLENDVKVEASGPTTLYSNKALYDGGAIWAAEATGTYSGHSTLIVTGSMTFMGNICRGHGGAIDLSDTDIDCERSELLICQVHQFGPGCTNKCAH